ncbi:hypothetical protein [Streptomyces albidochromogenes]|uniref:hypothetical protein n=1 Tax=Streptomyces albidochromogenes TaxID=329524 RepID=UPI001FCA596A|nr:hypothetical protein [Streptomyces albidochromogenes]
MKVEPTNMSFPLKCVDHEVSSTLNELTIKTAREEGSLRITTSSNVRWALTVEQ